jgi:hypothetical protein
MAIKGGEHIWQPLEPPYTLVCVGDGTWTLNNAEGLPGYGVTNRMVIMVLKGTGEGPCLAVFNPVFLNPTNEKLVRDLEAETGCKVKHVISPGYKHHFYIPIWLETFPEARAHMFPRDAAQPEMIELPKDRVDCFDVEQPESILKDLRASGELEVCANKNTYTNTHMLARGLDVTLIVAVTFNLRWG